MIEKWRKIPDEGGETGAVLTDLSNAFDSIDHSLLIAKLNTCGSEKQSINLIYSYLAKREQRTKVESAVSSWEILGSFTTFYSIYISVSSFLKNQQISALLDVQMTILLKHTIQI